MFSYSLMSNSLPPRGLQHASLPCTSPSPGACSNSHPFQSMMPSNLLIFCHSLLLLPSPSPPALNLAQHQGLFQDNDILKYKYTYVYIYICVCVCMYLSGWGMVNPSVACILIKKLEWHKTDWLFLTLVFLQDLVGLIFPTDSLSPPAQVVSSHLWVFWIHQFKA